MENKLDVGTSLFVWGEPQKKHQKELFFIGVAKAAKLKHTISFFKKNDFVFDTKEGRKYLKKQSNFFLSLVIVVEVHFLRELFEKFLFQVESASF